MKQLLHCCFFIFVSASAAFAQNKKLKSQHIVNPCNREEVIYSYDKKGKLTEEVSRQTAFNDKTIVNRTIYEYNKDNIARVLHICNDTLIKEEINEYTGNDLVHFRRIIKGKLVLDEAYTYKKGQVLSVIATTPEGVLVQNMKYDNAHKAKETITRSDNTITASEKEFADGNMKRVEHYAPPFNTTPEVVNIYVYDYYGNVIDDRTIVKGVETKRIIQRFERNIPASKKEFEYGTPVYEVLYDEYGNPLREEKFDSKEVIIYESKFTTERLLKEVKVLKNDTVQCTKTYNNEYWD